jgi:hypothetical protein
MPMVSGKHHRSAEHKIELGVSTSGTEGELPLLTGLRKLNERLSIVVRDLSATLLAFTTVCL